MSTIPRGQVSFHLGTAVAELGDSGVAALLAEHGVKAPQADIATLVTQGGSKAGIDANDVPASLEKQLEGPAVAALLGKDGYVKLGDSYVVSFRNAGIRFMGNLADRLERDTGVRYDTITSGGGNNLGDGLVTCWVSNPRQAGANAALGH